MSVSEKEEGRGGGWLGLIRIIKTSRDRQKDVRAEAERGRNTGRGRERQEQRQEERIYRSPPCVLRRVYLACVFLRIIFFFLFVDPQLRLVYDMPR